jgi:uncharacterized RDD family membrane protein YckC
MTQIPAGWYPDPAPQTYPGRQRYWDGGRWTEHLHDSQPPAYASAYPPYQPYGYVAPTPTPTTPDGVPLAGWGPRAGALLIDGAIQFVLNLIVWIPVVLVNLDRIREFGDRFDAWSRQTEPGAFPLSVYRPLIPLLIELGAASILIGAIYTIAFWRWKQATPGKLALGLRIRRRESPDFPWSAILLRYGFYLALGVAGLIPFVGYGTGFLQLLDYLWPLWDDKRQALHDKVAGTNVVTLRRSATEDVAAAPAPATAGLPPRW